MGKVLALMYSFLILVQSFNISLEDFSKINALIEHAQFHKEMYGDTFFQFLAEHYGNAQENHQGDHKEHKDLPFKDSHHMCSHIYQPFITPNTSFNLDYQEFVEKSSNFFYKERATYFNKSAVFQPPKYA